MGVNGTLRAGWTVRISYSTWLCMESREEKKLAATGERQRFKSQVPDLRRSESEQRQQLRGPRLPLSPCQGGRVPPTRLRHGQLKRCLHRFRRGLSRCSAPAGFQACSNYRGRWMFIARAWSLRGAETLPGQPANSSCRPSDVFPDGHDSSLPLVLLLRLSASLRVSASPGGQHCTTSPCKRLPGRGITHSTFGAAGTFSNPPPL